MKYVKVTMATALQMAGETEIYILAPLSDQTTLADLKKAAAYVVPVEEDEQIPEIEAAPEEQPKGKIAHDEIIRMAQEGCTPREIAKKIGCSEQTVRNHIARG